MGRSLRPVRLSPSNERYGGGFEVSRKRIWVHVQKPAAYEVYCNLCGWDGCAWSEFDGHIWCYKCEKDVKGTPGIFGGPVPIALSAMLGIVFHRVSIRTGKVSYMDDRGKYSGWKKVEQPAQAGEGE